MKIAVAGTGYVGLSLAVLLSQHNDVIAVDSDSVHLTKNAKKIVTDSGGLQCEAFYAGVQCVFVLDYVAWPETMVGNRNQLAKADHKDILIKLSAEQRIDPSYQPFGDGHAAEKICEIIEKYERNEL